MERKYMSRFDAYEVNVEMEGSIQEYAMNFLKIFNTVKSQDSLIRVTNDYGNGVQVVCTKDALEATKDYLSNFGEVTSVDEVLCVKVEDDFDYDYDKYEDMVLVPWLD